MSQDEADMVWDAVEGLRASGLIIEPWADDIMLWLVDGMLWLVDGEMLSDGDVLRLAVSRRLVEAEP